MVIICDNFWLTLRRRIIYLPMSKQLYKETQNQNYGLNKYNTISRRIMSQQMHVTAFGLL